MRYHVVDAETTVRCGADWLTLPTQLSIYGSGGFVAHDVYRHADAGNGLAFRVEYPSHHAAGRCQPHGDRFLLVAAKREQSDQPPLGMNEGQLPRMIGTDRKSTRLN